MSLRDPSSLPNPGPMPDADYYAGGGCVNLALAFMAAYPHMKMAVEWYDDRGRRAIAHAVAYDPRTRKAFHFDGTEDVEHAVRAATDSYSLGVVMDQDPGEAARHMGVRWSPSAPWDDDRIFDAWNDAEAHWGLDAHTGSRRIAMPGFRTCDGCGTKMPAFRRRNRVGDRLLCDGCTPGRPGSPGRPVGYHGSKETSMNQPLVAEAAAPDLEHCGSCKAEIGDAGLVRQGSLLVCGDGCKTAELSRAEVRYVQDNFYGTSGKDRVTWQNGQGMGATQVAVYVVDDRTLILRSHITKPGPDIILRDLSQSEAQAKVNEFWPGLTPHNRWASIQRQAHDSGDGETIYHCGRGSERFWTIDGLKTLAETAGTVQKVLVNTGSGGVWRDAMVHSFGEQALLEVTLQRGKRSKVTYWTPEHRWLVRTRQDEGRKDARVVTTQDLQPGDRLSWLLPKSLISSSTPSPQGIAHGIVFGDGTRAAKGSVVRLWGEKGAQLLRYFSENRLEPVKTAQGVLGQMVLDLPAYMKARPSLDESVPYLYGWLAGYFAADGCVSRKGDVVLHSASRETLEFAQTLATRLGIGTYEIGEVKRKGYGVEPTPLYKLPFIASTLQGNFFLARDHRQRYQARAERGFNERIGWVVKSVKDIGLREEVYCPRVPEHENFVLDGWINTMNCPFCGAGQVTGRSDGTAMCGFCNRAFTVQVQPEHPSMPQTIDGVPVDDPSTPGSLEEAEEPEEFAPAAEEEAEEPQTNPFTSAKTAGLWEQIHTQPAIEQWRRVDGAVEALVQMRHGDPLGARYSINYLDGGMPVTEGRKTYQGTWAPDVETAKREADKVMGRHRTGSVAHTASDGPSDGGPDKIEVDCHYCEQRHTGEYHHEGQWGEGPIFEVLCDRDGVVDYYTREAAVGGGVQAYRTATGATLDEDAYLRHLAIAHAPDKDAVLTQVRASRGQA